MIIITSDLQSLGEIHECFTALLKYPLVMTNSSPWYRWPIEIDGLPIINGDFPWLC